MKSFFEVAATELAYAAGLFDGEGSVAIVRNCRGTKTYHQVRLDISNTDRRMLTWLQDRFGGSIGSKFRANPAHKPAWGWIIMDARAQAFLGAIDPYCVIKRERIAVALEFRTLIQCHGGRSQPIDAGMFQRREALRDRLRALNRKGQPVAQEAA